MRNRLSVIIVLFAFLIVVPFAGAWKSNSWQSPTGNIICHYYGVMVECGTRDSGYVALVTPTSASYFKQLPLVTSLAKLYGPILQYGQTWAGPVDGNVYSKFVCLSTITSMRCTNPNGNSFFLSRTGVQIYR
jgi:hypothetical protein